MSVVSQDAIAASQTEGIHGALAAERTGDEQEARRRGWLMRRLLLVADLVGLMTSFVLALAVSQGPVEIDKVNTNWEIVLFAATLPLWILLFRVHGLYDRDEERTDHSTVDDIVGVLHVVTLGTWSFLALTYVTGLPSPTLRRLILFWVLAVVMVPTLRAAARIVGRRHPAYVERVVIVGTGRVARLLESKIEKHPEYGLELVGFVDHDAGAPQNGSGPIGLIGTTDQLPALVQENRVGRVVIAFSTDSNARTLEVIRSLRDSDVQIDIVPRMFEVLGAGSELHTIEGIPMVGLPAPRLSGSARLLKRSLDVVGALAGLVLLSPVLLLTAVCIKLDTRGPVFFRQVRVGFRNEVFEVYKFRTMVKDADARKAEVAHLNMHANGDPRMFKVPADPRVTRVGAVLRRWRIDELPQLINVLKGEMSLVGPRPLIMDEDQYVESWARRRLDLKPGMTGLWQVLGASDIPFDEMTKLDYLYVTNWSLKEDLRLILLTLPALTRARSAY